MNLAGVWTVWRILLTLIVYDVIHQKSVPDQDGRCI
jgi:hypothetical protein